MRGIVVCGVAGALLFAAPVARAQVSRGFPAAPSDNDWSATQGHTVGAGRNVVSGEAGWPGLAVQYLHGLDPRTDVGLRIGFNYGFENTTAGLVGVDVQVPVRRYLMRSGQFDIEAHVAPGFTFYGNNGQMLFGVGGPVGIVAAYQMDPKLTLSVGGDVPLLLSLTHPFGFLFGPLVGGGAEYKIDKDLAVTGKVRVGPEFAFDSRNGATGDFAFQTLVGVAYALR
jgi:hypothetical protein